MSMETMSFILGGILIGSGIFGGGLEIRELKLPQIGTIPRVFAFALGAGFVALAVTLNPQSPIKSLLSQGGNTSQQTTMTFQEPMHGDLRVDACLLWAQQCGEPAATAWCKGKGMAKAIEFPLDPVGARGMATRLIGTNEVCSKPFCTSFAYVVCAK